MSIIVCPGATTTSSICRDATVAKEGNCVQLNCATTLAFPVNWEFISAATRETVHLYMAGSLLETYRGRFDVDKATDGQYNLKINPVLSVDAGRYRCIDDGGFGSLLIDIEFLVLRE